MKRALVVKALTDQIILVRVDNSDLLSLSVPCRKINPGTLILLDTDVTGCPVHSVDGKTCRSSCHRQNHVMIIEHKDKNPSAVAMSNQDTDRHAI
jgi:hypothetical protein